MMGANKPRAGRPASWYPSMSEYLPKRNPTHVVHHRSGPWKFYGSKTAARVFTMCAFCNTPQLVTCRGWMYRKHFGSGFTMLGPVTQHACPTCAKDPTKVDLEANTKVLGPKR